MELKEKEWRNGVGSAYRSDAGARWAIRPTSCPLPAARALPSRYLESRPTKQPAIRKAGHRIQDRRLDVTGECLAGRLDVGLDRDRERYRYRLDVYLSSLVILT